MLAAGEDLLRLHAGEKTAGVIDNAPGRGGDDACAHDGSRLGQRQVEDRGKDSIKAEGAGFANDGGEDLAVAEMDAVEVADGDYRRAKAGGDLRDRAVDGNGWHAGLVHRLTGTVSPS